MKGLLGKSYSRSEGTGDSEVYRLTERRFQKAQSILERYREELCENLTCNASRLERELRDCWEIGYQELKSIMRDLMKRDSFKHLAVYYMEHSNASVGVVDDLKAVLAKVYGVSHYCAPEMEEKREAFWEEFRTAVGK